MRTDAGTAAVLAGLAAVLVVSACERSRGVAADDAPALPSARAGTVHVHGGGAPPRTSRPFVTFTDVTEASGLGTFRLHAGHESPKRWLLESIGGGLCAADLDGDGDVDLCLVDGAGMTDDGEVVDLPGAGTRLFRNDGGLRFTDVTAAAGAVPRGHLLGGAAADCDGDGDADLCLVGYDAVHLLRNRGDGTFEDATRAAGLVPPRHDCAASCSWADVDGDGLLDLFVATYSDVRGIVEHTRANRLAHGLDSLGCDWKGQLVYCGPRGLPARANRLWMQRPGGTFVLAPERLEEPERPALQAVFADLDDDGDLDAYVANDGVENSVLVRERAGDGTVRLVDRGIATGAVASLDLIPQASMGVAVADADGDLRLDVAVTNFEGEYHALYRNVTRAGGPLLFEDVGTRRHFSASPQPRVGWGIGLVDFDHDGVLDAFVAAGHVYPDGAPGSERHRRSLQTNQVLRGLGPPRHLWEDVSDRAGPHFADARLWRGAVFPDLDGDGDCDVVVTAQHAAPAVLRNDGGEAGSWVRFDLRPRPGLPTPAGARVTITLPDGGRRVAELQCGSSYASSDDPRVHFGLGAAEVLPRVEVRWPDGTRTVLEGVATRRVVVAAQR